MTDRVIKGAIEVHHMVRGRSHTGAGELAVMEVELIEPYLYPDQGPHMGEHFAAALEAMLHRLTLSR